MSRPDTVKFEVSNPAMSAGITMGQRAERVAIVAWLRSEAERLQSRATIGAYVRSLLADAIERGDHLTEEAK